MLNDKQNKKQNEHENGNEMNNKSLTTKYIYIKKLLSQVKANTFIFYCRL